MPLYWSPCLAVTSGLGQYSAALFGVPGTSIQPLASKRALDGAMNAALLLYHGPAPLNCFGLEGGVPRDSGRDGRLHSRSQARRASREKRTGPLRAWQQERTPAPGTRPTSHAGPPDGMPMNLSLRQAKPGEGGRG